MYKGNKNLCLRLENLCTSLYILIYEKKLSLQHEKIIKKINKTTKKLIVSSSTIGKLFFLCAHEIYLDIYVRFWLNIANLFQKKRNKVTN